MIAPPIGPDGTVFEVAESLLVCIVTAPPAAGVLPIVKPFRVTVTAVLAASAEPPVVIMMEVAPGAAADKDAPPDTAAEGVKLLQFRNSGIFHTPDSPSWGIISPDSGVIRVGPEKLQKSE